MFDLLPSEVRGTTSLGADTVADWLTRLGQADVTHDDGACIDLLESLERLKSAAAAMQARLTNAFADSQRARASLWPERTRKSDAEVSRSIWSQIALARRESPHRGQRHVGLARALREMPSTQAALASGDITEWQATLVVRETAVLSAADRQQVDTELDGRLGPLGDAGVAREARRIADRVDPEAALRRMKRAEADRSVSVRPAPDAMTRLTGNLPLAQGVAAYAALRKHAESLRTQGDPRGIGQIMADEMYARLVHAADTSRASSPSVEIGLVMSERTLLRGGDDAAVLTGPDGSAYGVVPAMLARKLVRQADKAWLRRLYAAPRSGELVAMDSRRRVFTGALRKLVVWRDQTCATPWCDAPVRHVDHVRAAGRGGLTRLDNAQALCEACNYAKEGDGWRVDVGDLDAFRIEVTTPTGHRHRHRPPRAPGHDEIGPEERLRRMRDDWIDGYGA